jgi:hypothetical protein
MAQKCLNRAQSRRGEVKEKAAMPTREVVIHAREFGKAASPMFVTSQRSAHAVRLSIQP